MLPPVYPTIMAVPGVVALIGDRCYRHGEAEPSVQAPYVTYFIVTGTPENNLSDPPPIDRVGVQVDCWSDGDEQVEQLATAVRNAMEPHAHMTSIVLNTRDLETRRYRIGMQFDWWLHR